MKKIFKIFVISMLTILLVFTLVSCKGDNPEEPVVNPPVVDEDPTVEPVPVPEPVDETRIFNADGSYGGTLNKDLFGEGTPKNGARDIVDSDYFLAPDIYNLPSTKSRIVLPKFKTYQKTMADSDGIACVMMILYRDGKDMSEYTEERLVRKYEEINGTTVHKNGTTSEGIRNLLSYLGYNDAEVNAFAFTTTSRANKCNELSSWLNLNLSTNCAIIARLQYGLKSEWKLIIGIDQMNSSSYCDDVVIMANPDDVLDHKQDGYTCVPIAQFWAWWMDAKPNGEMLDTYGSVCVELKNKETIKRVNDTSTGGQEVPELHLILNADGSFGGTTNSYFGKVDNGGIHNNLNSRYYKFLDVYNLQSTDTLHVLSNYRPFEQTMSSTCGICSCVTICAYYGYSDGAPAENNDFDELHLMYYFIKDTGSQVYNNGVGAPNMKKMLSTSFGITATSQYYSASAYRSESSKVYPTYESFIETLRSNLDFGTPMAVCWKPVGGHWTTIIGYDDMGTEDYIYDDIVIFADSYDFDDHYQDGYNVYNATTFYARWFNGNHTVNQAAFFWPRSTRVTKKPSKSLTVAQVMAEKVR